MVAVDEKILMKDCKAIAKDLHDNYYRRDISENDVLFLVLSVVAKLLSRYRPLKGGVGLSPRTYYNRYAKIAAFKEMRKEHRQQEKTTPLEALLTEISEDAEEPDGAFQRQEFVSAAFAEEITNWDFVSFLMSRASKKDQKIMWMVMEGYTLREIGRKMKMSKWAVLRRLRKYRRFLMEWCADFSSQQDGQG